MEKATVIGIVSAIVLLLLAIVLAGGNPLGFVDPPAALIIGGGIVCAVLIAFPLEEFKRMPKVMGKIFFNTKPDLLKIVEDIVALSEVARREGVLSLDSRAKELQDSDPFLSKGLQMIVDGMKAEAAESILDAEITALKERHSVGAEMVSQLGKAAPVFGLIATLIGLILMLSEMDPATIGHHMAVALTGTLYGAASANLFFLPFAGKLRYYNKIEAAAMELKMIGLLEIQKGESPRMIKMRLLTIIPPNRRPQEQE
ncbi:MAG: MotA/TolQ/ExbB proton channel family protein [Planctomycetaceae bacterium]|jgi:chemotaxis protein MotA|nr:MotA/TolQ/ExbB proton channel family protein [Planctomycetaceae bacterium]